MLGITTSIGKTIKTISDFLIGKAQRLTSWLKNIAEKLGGVEQLLKLIAMVAAALFLATNGNKILSFLVGAVKLLQGFNLQTALAAAKWLLLFLVLEDVFTFLQGGDSVFGRLLSEAGVDVDALREKISAFFEGAKQFGRDALDSLGQFWEEHKGAILVVLQALWQGLVDLTADIITLGGHLFDLLTGLITGFQTGDWTQFLTGCKELWQDFLDILNGLGRAAFGETWEPLKESAQAIWDWLKGFFDWFGDKITWAKNLWNGVKNFFAGGNGGDVDDSDGGDGPDKNSPGFRGMGGGKSSGGSGRTSNGKSPTGTQTSSGSTATSRNAASAFISGGRPVSTTTASQRPIAQTTNTKNITVKQENRQSYTFQVSDRNAASKLQSTVSSQSSQSTKDLTHSIVLTASGAADSFSATLCKYITVTEVTSNIQFESAEYGSYVLADGVITQIVTTVDGWTACTNDITPIKGRLTQTDAEARTSYTNRVASRGTGTVASIVSLLYSDVEGVTFAAGYENYNDTTDAAGRPPHSIEIVVQGGTDEDVANIIWKNKAGGIVRQKLLRMRRKIVQRPARPLPRHRRIC